MKTLESLKTVTLTLLIASLTILLTGCRSPATVIAADRDCIRLEQGQREFVPPFSGWFVPDARMLDILNRLDKAKIAPAK